MMSGDIVIFIGNKEISLQDYRLTLNNRYKIIRVVGKGILGGKMDAINLTNDSGIQWNYPKHLFKSLEEYRDEKLKDLGI